MLSEFLFAVQSPLILFSNNHCATYLSANHVFHSSMKHIVIDYHFVRDLVQSFKLCVVHVFTGDQLADALTKSLFWPRLFSLYNKISVIYDT